MNNHIKKPVVKILMLKGEKGNKGDQGTSIPSGGKTGQYLQKKSDADYDYDWLDINTVDFANVSGKPEAYPTTWDNVSGKPDTYAPTPSTIKEFTLSSSGWSESKYTISDSLITASSNQEIMPAVGITADQLKALERALVVDGGQAVGSLTLKALGTIPTIDIPIRVIFRGTI